MKIRDAAHATKIARQVIGNPARFLPLQSKKTNGTWLVKAMIGTLDDITVTVEIPERLTGVIEQAH